MWFKKSPSLSTKDKENLIRDLNTVITHRFKDRNVVLIEKRLDKETLIIQFQVDGENIAQISLS
jgi:hypothetical protein